MRTSWVIHPKVDDWPAIAGIWERGYELSLVYGLDRQPVGRLW